jgi:hypothetical protein
MPVSHNQQGRATRLLEALVALGITPAEIGRELNVTAEQLDRVRRGEVQLSLSRQVVLAAFAHDRAPGLRPEVATLRAQLRATFAYRSGATIVHSDPWTSPR